MSLNQNQSKKKKVYSDFIKQKKMKIIDKKYLKPVITADIETFQLNGEHIPFSIGFQIQTKEENIYKEWFVTDLLETSKYFKNGYSTVDIIEKCYENVFCFLEELNTYAGKNKIKVFFHNLSNFDGLILLKTLSKKQESIIFIPPRLTSRDGEFFEIRYKNVVFVDSLKLLPESLDKLQKQFYPEAPTAKEKLNFKDYNINNLFEYEKVIRPYMKNDIELLFNIMINAQKFFHSEFPFIDIVSYLTLPSIAMEVFLTKYIETDTIYKLDTNQDSFIREAYFGGACDVYIPTGTDLLAYDVNSLFPYCMTMSLPIGKPVFQKFKGGRSLLPTDYGFFNCNISYYGDLKAPLLPVRKNGVNIYPKGQWYGTYFSEELKLAQSEGYKITVLRGLVFDQKKIFEEPITDLYKKRLDNKKNGKGYIFKLILNSIYGRLSMKKTSRITKIVSPKEYLKLEQMHRIHFRESLEGTDFYLVEYDSGIFEESVNVSTTIDWKALSPEERKNQIIENEKVIRYSKAIEYKEKNLNVAVQLGAAITSFSRIYMHSFKNIKYNPVYYSDCDSIFVKYPLDSQFVSQTQLGLFKLEHKIIEAFFLAPKIYCYSYLGENDKISNKIVFKGFPKERMKALGINFFKKKYKKPEYYSYRRLSVFCKSKKDFKIYSRYFKMNVSFLFNKRNKRINSNGIWFDTEPLQIHEKRPLVKQINKNNFFYKIKLLLFRTTRIYNLIKRVIFK